MACSHGTESIPEGREANGLHGLAELVQRGHGLLVVGGLQGDAVNLVRDLEDGVAQRRVIEHVVNSIRRHLGGLFQ